MRSCVVKASVLYLGRLDAFYQSMQGVCLLGGRLNACHQVLHTHMVASICVWPKVIFVCVRSISCLDVWPWCSQVFHTCMPILHQTFPKQHITRKMSLNHLKPKYVSFLEKPI